jgi:hypothetical protein
VLQPEQPLWFRVGRQNWWKDRCLRLLDDGMKPDAIKRTASRKKILRRGTFNFQSKGKIHDGFFQGPICRKRAIQNQYYDSGSDPRGQRNLIDVAAMGKAKSIGRTWEAANPHPSLAGGLTASPTSGPFRAEDSRNIVTCPPNHFHEPPLDALIVKLPGKVEGPQARMSTGASALSIFARPVTSNSRVSA